MVLVDSSIWIDYFKDSKHPLLDVLHGNSVLIHILVIGEISMGIPPSRMKTLQSLHKLPRAVGLSDVDVMRFVEQHKLYGKGIGYVDAHLLASAHFGQARFLWARDRRLESIAEQMGVGYQP